jgi:hypothetical protein
VSPSSVTVGARRTQVRRPWPSSRVRPGTE